MPEPQIILQMDPYELAQCDPDVAFDIAQRAKEAAHHRREELAALLARQQSRSSPRPEQPRVFVVRQRTYAQPNFPVTQDEAPQTYAKPDSTANIVVPTGPSAPAEDSRVDRGWDVAPPAKPSKGGKHAGGRPRRVAPWFEDVAHAMRDGTPVRVALVRCGMRLTEREIKSLYRLKAFKVLYQRERREHLKKWGLRGVRVNDRRKFFRGPRA